jgi:hypothetical protein
MTQPALLAALVVALFGCQRNRATAADEERDSKAVVPSTPVAAEPAAAPTAAPAPATGGQIPPAPSSVSPDGVWKASPLGRDVERICNVLTYAGVADKSANQQLDAILEWLPRNIESEAGREFLGSIGNLEGTAKADALDAGARKVGLQGCPLAAEWRK